MSHEVLVVILETFVELSLGRRPHNTLDPVKFFWGQLSLPHFLMRHCGCGYFMCGVGKIGVFGWCGGRVLKKLGRNYSPSSSIRPRSSPYGRSGGIGIFCSGAFWLSAPPVTLRLRVTVSLLLGET